MNLLTTKLSRALTLSTLGLAALAVPARSQIFVANGFNTDAYNLDGSPLTTSLITGSSAQFNLAVANNQIYVTQQGSGAPGNGSIGVYNMNGTPVNANLITGLYNSLSVAVSGGYIYVGDSTGAAVGKYNLDGSVVNSTLISGLSTPTGLLVAGGHIYVADAGLNTVGEYNLDGTPVNSSLVVGGVGSDIYNLTSDGANLFVTDYGLGTVGEYGLDGTPINANLISGLDGPSGVAVYDGDLYVGINWDANVAEYATDGTLINNALIATGLGNIQGIAVVTPTPEPSTCLLALAGGTALLVRRRLTARA